jgi:translation initiation factor IF-2
MAAENALFAKSLKAQNERVMEELDTRIYELVGELTSTDLMPIDTSHPRLH